MKKKTFITFMLVPAVIVGLLGLAFGVSPYLTAFNNQYGTSTTVLNTCNLCHTGTPRSASNVNAFGTDYANNGYDFTAIEALDSDGDGFSNIAEIQARTFPGDPASVPAPVNTGAALGVYSNGVWYIDKNGNDAWDGTPTDSLFYFGGLAGTVPVMGDWTGTGVSRVGVFANGSWYLDLNGNGTWDGTAIDRAYYFGNGLAGAVPVTGDWTGSGSTKIGVYVNGIWYLDLNGNGIWDGTPTDGLYHFGEGMAGAVPVTGHWSGAGPARIGIYANGYWYLDLNGNGMWDGTPTDSLYYFGGGMAGGIPVTGDWAGTGTTRIGVFANGFWYVDLNGNGAWDGSPTDGRYYFGGGLAGAVPIASK